MRRRVDLPQPLGPRIERNWPAGTPNETRSRAGRGARPSVKTCETLSRETWCAFTAMPRISGGICESRDCWLRGCNPREAVAV
jgi:hypothetical protein